MTTSYVMPQALVYQEFTLLPTPLVQPLRACVVGPAYQIVSDNVTGALGEYDSAVQTCYSWPDRATGAVVDQDWTHVYIDDALLQYFYNSLAGDNIQATYCLGLDLMTDSFIKNAIRADVTNWKTYGAYARATALKNRDVALGDVIKVAGMVDGSLVTVWSYIAGFINEKIAGIVGTAYRDENDQDWPFDTSSSTSPTIVYSKAGTGSGTVDITAAAEPPQEPEQGYIDGVRSDEYVLEVIEGGTPAETVIQVTSASGTDDVAALVPSDWGVSTPFGDKGLEVTWTRTGADEFEVGTQWLLTVRFGAVVVYPHSAGTYTGPSDSTYVITVTTGGQFGGTEGNPYVTVSTSTGIDSSGPHEVTGLDTPITIGSYGVTISFSSQVGYNHGLYLGDRFYIPVTAPVAGAVRTLVLGHDLPSGLLGLNSHGVCGTPTNLAVTLYIKKDIEVEEDREGYAPLVNWTTSATQVCLESGILSYDSTWVDDSGTMLALSVKGGSAWVKYRALRTTLAASVGSLDAAEDVAATLGTVTADNPLAFGVYMALLNSNGEDVKYVGVSSDDTTGYSTALSMLGKRDDVHGLIPLTFDSDVQDLVVAHCDAMSTAETGRWRRAWVCTELVEDAAIITGALAVISDDPASVGVQYTLVEFSGAPELLVNGVRAGDILRAGYTTDGFGNEVYDEYTVDAVLSENSLRLTSGPSAPVVVASKVEIWRNYTVAEQISATLLATGRFDNRRVSNIWPDYYEDNGVLTAGYFAACACAGLRSTTVPQRSMTNIELLGIDSVHRTTELFTEDQLNTLAAGGIAIITQNAAGTVYLRHDLTTDMTDTKHREESVTANLDSVSYLILEQIAPYIGSSNLTQDTINQISVEIKDAIKYLKDNSTIPSVGGQLIDGTITSIERHATLLDRLVVKLSLDMPIPLNNIEVHLVV